MPTTRETLSEILDQLQEDQIEAVLRYARRVYAQGSYGISVDVRVDPELYAGPPYRPLADAPDDDEPITDEDRAAIREGRSAFAQGDTVLHEKAMRSIGL